MAEIQIYYIATSKNVNIRSGGEVINYKWGSLGKWTKLKKPTGKEEKVKYNKTSKNKYKNKSSWKSGGVTLKGTSIPAKANRMIDGTETQVDVRYRTRDLWKYERTKTLTKSNKMKRTKFTPYEYQLQYKDAISVDKTYSTFDDLLQKTLVFFADRYYKDGVETLTASHIPHPQVCEFEFIDVQKNFNQNSNNSESRDNKGTYVLSNVRANVLAINLEFNGLDEEQGAFLLSTLNPSTKYPYIEVQYLDVSTKKVKTGTFYPESRKANKLHTGVFESIAVRLVEV